jgi:hypothetical protein
VSHGEKPSTALDRGHSTVTNPTERELEVGHVEEGFVDANGAGRGVVQDVLFVDFVLTEVVKR